MNRKIITCVITCFILLLYGCGAKTHIKNTLPDSKKTVQTQTQGETSEEKHQEAAYTEPEKPLKQEDGEKERKNTEVPVEIKSYIKQFTNDEILFYAVDDMDADGKAERIVAAGTPSKDESMTDYTCLLIFNEDKAKPMPLSENLVGGGYSVNSVNLVELNGKPGKFLHLGLTNFAALYGFQLIGLKDKTPYEFCYSASATGSGDDYLRDNDKDGKYDAYIQTRRSYDVFYYPFNRTYTMENGNFILDGTYVELPEYPETIKDVLMQYMTISALDAYDSEEVKTRLSALCRDPNARQFNFPEEFTNKLFNTLMSFDDAMTFDIKESGDSAEVMASYLSEKKQTIQISFTLAKIDGKWVITKII